MFYTTVSDEGTAINTVRTSTMPNWQVLSYQEYSHLLLASENTPAHVADEAAVALLAFLLLTMVLPIRQVVVATVVSHNC